MSIGGRGKICSIDFNKFRKVKKLIPEIQSDIKKLEDYLGFLVERREVTLEANEPHDEILSYGLCQRFYGKEEELRIAIEKTTVILMELKRCDNRNLKKEISLFYSLLGDMYYLASDFTKSINCFQK